MQAAAAAAACAKRAVDQNQSKPIPDNVNRRLRLSASDRSNRILRAEKQTNRETETQKADAKTKAKAIGPFPSTEDSPVSTGWRQDKA
ncbi:hypothetical protein QO004_004150 [Rhizobium mesoamericanum]|uniref:hypothetical protein n=1 Tax=Rhizobium mesoamericanum TaxID=1079800 RepID=UPI0027862A6E|nr:hypothetical protein [Rhizobium mesoamericanum]MDQ0562345.1 hypothetical protein [Rhizobium mesoamericanum]